MGQKKRQTEKANPLAHLDKRLRRLIQSAVSTDDAASVIRTAKGHVQLRASNGETACVSRNSGTGRCGTRMVEADLRRCFPAWNNSNSNSSNSNSSSGKGKGSGK